MRNDNSKYEKSRATERVLDILELLENADSAQSITRIAEQVDVPKATAYRLVTVLHERGYLYRDGARGGFSLGPRLLRLAARTRHQMRLIRVAAPLLEELARNTGESCQVSVREGDYALCVVRQAAPTQREWSLAGEVGSVFPLHATAVGKVLAAFMPTSDAAVYLANPLTVSTPHTRTDPDNIRREWEAIRAQGYARDDEEFRVGLSAVAVPVRGVDETVIAAVGVPFLRQRKSPDDSGLETLIAALKHTANEISVGLG